MTTNVQTKTNQTEGGAPEEVIRAQQIARLSNEHLLMLREAVTALHRNLDSSFWYSALKIKSERDALLKEVQTFKWELEEEYAPDFYEAIVQSFKSCWELCNHQHKRPKGDG